VNAGKLYWKTPREAWRLKKPFGPTAPAGPDKSQKRCYLADQ
jgi:hypothetical protein